MSPWADHLLREAPGPGTVGKTGSRKVSVPQGNPTDGRAGIQENLFLEGGGDVDGHDVPFLKLSALFEGSHDFLPLPFFPSLAPSTHLHGAPAP